MVHIQTICGYPIIYYKFYLSYVSLNHLHFNLSLIVFFLIHILSDNNIKKFHNPFFLSSPKNALYFN